LSILNSLKQDKVTPVCNDMKSLIGKIGSLIKQKVIEKRDEIVYVSAFGDKYHKNKECCKTV